MIPKSKPADPLDRLHALMLDVSKLGRVLAEINADPELRDLVVETISHRYSSYNMGITLGHLIHQARTLFDQIELLSDDEIRVVSSDPTLTTNDPRRVQPLREVWPLCPHDRARRMPPPPDPQGPVPTADANRHSLPREQDTNPPEEP